MKEPESPLKKSRALDVAVAVQSYHAQRPHNSNGWLPEQKAGSRHGLSMNQPLHFSPQGGRRTFDLSRDGHHRSSDRKTKRARSPRPRGLQNMLDQMNASSSSGDMEPLLRHPSPLRRASNPPAAVRGPSFTPSPIQSNRFVPTSSQLLYPRGAAYGNFNGGQEQQQRIYPQGHPAAAAAPLAPAPSSSQFSRTAPSTPNDGFQYRRLSVPSYVSPPSSYRHFFPYSRSSHTHNHSHNHSHSHSHNHSHSHSHSHNHSHRAHLSTAATAASPSIGLISEHHHSDSSCLEMGGRRHGQDHRHMLYQQMQQYRPSTLMQDQRRYPESMMYLNELKRQQDQISMGMRDSRPTGRGSVERAQSDDSTDLNAVAHGFEGMSIRQMSPSHRVPWPPHAQHVYFRNRHFWSNSELDDEEEGRQEDDEEHKELEVEDEGEGEEEEEEEEEDAVEEAYEDQSWYQDYSFKECKICTDRVGFYTLATLQLNEDLGGEHFRRKLCKHIAPKRATDCEICSICLRRYASVRIKDGHRRIGCPISKCQTVFYLDDLARLVSPELLVVYRQRCAAVYGNRLKELLRTQPDQARQLLEEGKSLVCPGCSVLISKAEGCDQMQCTCGRKFSFKKAMAEQLAQLDRVLEKRGERGGGVEAEGKQHDAKPQQQEQEEEEEEEEQQQEEEEEGPRRSGTCGDEEETKEPKFKPRN